MSGLRIKPGREASILTAFVAVVMGLFGLFVMVPAMSAMSSFGPAGSIGPAFAIVWVLAAFGIAAFYGYNAFSQRGASLVDIDTTGQTPFFAEREGGPEEEDAAPGSDFEVRLRKLESLRRDGLITESEYEAKRAVILAERW